MPKLRHRTKLTFKVTRRYLEKINLFSQSYYQLYQRYSDTRSHSEINNNSAYTSDANLETVLLDQIEMLRLRDNEKRVLEQFVDALDDSGLLSDWKQTKHAILKTFPEFSDRKVSDLLKIFQTLEPEGIGTRSISEFLIIQIKNFQLEDEEFKNLCINILKQEQAIVSRNIPVIANKLNCSEEEIIDALYFIKNNLNNTLPGKLYASNKTQFAIPSAEIYIDHDHFSTKMLEDYSFVSDSVILKDLQERKSLLENILKYFFSLQSITLYQSVKFLMPVTQKQVADKLGLSYSFVNRIVNKKYITLNNQTILLRNLFQRSINKSQQTVFFLKALFENPAYKNKPDTQIQKILKKQGINIARRTVNYYRNKTSVL